VQPRQGFIRRPTNSLSGKLKFFCPTLFSSLTLWEKEALENSGWLFHSTSVAKGVTEGGLGSSGPARESSTHLSEVGKPSDQAIDHLDVSCSFYLPANPQEPLSLSVPQVFSSREPVSTPILLHLI
jgi:hypothetical protein